MSVAPVRIVSIIGVLSKLDKVINTCGKSHIFHPDNAMHFYNNAKQFQRMSETNLYSSALHELKEKIQSSNQSLQFVDVSNFNINSKEINDYIDYLSSKLDVLLNQKSKCLNKIDEYNKKIKELSHFVGLSINIEDLFSCKYIKVRFGSIPEESYEKLISYTDNPYVYFSPFTKEDSKYWGLYVTPIQEATEIDRIFKNLFFERVKISINDSTPEKHIEILEKQLEKTNKELLDIQEKIDGFWKIQYSQCMRFYSKLEELNTYFEIKKYVYKYKDSFILVGWIPEEEIESFSNNLEGIYGIEYTIEHESEGLKFSPPVLLKNKKIFKPFELFVSMYGLPSYNEMDPTALMSILYSFLFGIMFADFGQGIVLSLVGLVLWKFKGSKLGQIMMPCGIFASIFGFLFGSVFGDEHLLDNFYKDIFGLEEKPIDIMEPSTINMVIVFSILIGVIIILISMFANIYSSFKVLNYSKAIFGSNGIAGLIFYSSVVFAIVNAVIFKFDFVNVFYIVILILIPLALILFSEPLGELCSGKENWKPKNIGEYLTQNFFELFEVILSYVTNTISFIRIGIFVLVHAGMMSVVFTIADFTGNSLGIVGYIFVVILGNIFIIFLETLLAGIQVLRLNFYEIFSRFFSGQGRPYIPVRFKV